MNNHYRKRTAILVSAVTGELMCELHDGDRVLLKRSPGRARECTAVTGKVRHPGKGYTRLPKGETRALLPTLTAGEQRLVLAIALYVSWKDGSLRFDNGKAVGVDVLAKTLGYETDKNVRTHLSGLKKRHVVVQDKEGVLYVNPWIAGCGGSVPEATMLMFSEYPVLSRGGKLSGELIEELYAMPESDVDEIML